MRRVFKGNLAKKRKKGGEKEEKRKKRKKKKSSDPSFEALINFTPELLPSSWAVRACYTVPIARGTYEL